MSPRILLGFVVACFVTLATENADAYTEQVVYTFCDQPGCGFLPLGSLLSDEQGRIFGVTRDGGENGFGTAYELTPVNGRWKFKTIFNFSSTVGIPNGGLIRDSAGNLYGMTDDAVYELVSNAKQTKWQEKTLYTFGDFDGQVPFGALTYFGAASGAPYDGVSPLYGVTELGGYNENGVVFALSPKGRAWNQSVLYRFCATGNCSDGSTPENIVVASPQKIYGSTIRGGAACGCGTIFELDALRTSNKGPWQHKTLHEFCEQAGGCTDGVSPTGNLVLDSEGNIFGTTARGGNADNGTIFEVVPGGARASESVLYRFCALDDCQDGSFPEGGLTMGSDGTLFGTTVEGGNFHDDGEVFSFADSQLTVLYAFCPGQSCTDGEEPQWPVLLNSGGELFGVAGTGDATGLVFELSP